MAPHRSEAWFCGHVLADSLSHGNGSRPRVSFGRVHHSLAMADSAAPALSGAIPPLTARSWHLYPYFVYGLNVRSDLLLAGLPRGGDGSDVAIKEGELSLPSAFDGVTEDAWLLTRDATYLRCSLGSCRVRDGREITVMPASGVRPGPLVELISGMAFAILFHQRRELVLHASAVAVSGGVVAFIGRPLSGKSTLAAALLSQGCTLVTDDLMPVRFVDGIPVVYPGVPVLKLWPDAVRVTGRDPAGMPTVWPGGQKRLWNLEEAVLRHALPLSRLYILDQGSEQTVSRMPPAEAVYELARGSYGARLLHAVDTARQFRQATELVQLVPVYRLRRVPVSGRLPELVGLVEDHLSHPATEPSADSGG